MPGGCTSSELAQLTSTHERYVREWLEQQAVVGILDVDQPGAASTARRYTLPPAHAEILVDRDNPLYLAPLAQLMVGAVHPVRSVIEAFRSGSGVPFADYGPDMREGQGRLNRVAFLQRLARDWLPQLPDIQTRLNSEPSARVAEIGSGAGWASIGLAIAYPRIRVDGFDLDPASVTLAQANAAEMRLADRVHFAVRDAAQLEAGDPYDLVLAFECVHDMADPVGALRAMRNLASDRGAVVVMDERVGASFAERDEVTEPMLYGFSVLHCLPAGMTSQLSAGTGAVMRPSTFHNYALRAGFTEVVTLPIEDRFYAFYRLIR
jgi:SAM-dependent methyltransferase